VREIIASGSAFSMRQNVYLRAVVAGIVLPVLIASAQKAEPVATPGRNVQLEDAVAAVFERARTEAGSQPLERISRSDVEKLVCTASVIDGSHGDPMRLPFRALYKTDQPGKVSEALQRLASYRDHVGFRRFAVAVWAVRPQQTPAQFWVGIRLYVSPGQEFVENHFTDQVFYKDKWKAAVVPQCKRASAKR
jgi:hypothetical protein